LVRSSGLRNSQFRINSYFVDIPLADLQKDVTFAPSISITMKQDIHPKNYRLVVFKDISCDYAFLTRSTVDTKDTIKWTDGKEYPLVKLEISQMSHPYYTGKMKLVDTAGRVDKFRTRYSKKKEVTKEKE
jgi:large subunit ribosomal protein L31